MTAVRYPLRMQRLRTMLLSCLCSTFVTSTLLAAASPISPPVPTLRKVPAAWMGFGLMFLFFGVVITISLMSSKRGHQD